MTEKKKGENVYFINDSPTFRGTITNQHTREILVQFHGKKSDFQNFHNFTAQDFSVNLRLRNSQF